MQEFSAPAQEVVETVAAFEQGSPLDLPPLIDAVSEETATRLMAEWDDQTEPIEFTYVSYHITVSPTGAVALRLGDPDGSSPRFP